MSFICHDMPVLRAGRNRFAGHSTFLTCMAAWLYGPVTSWTEFTRGCWGALSGYAWSEPGLGGCNPHWRSSVGRGVGKEYGVGGRGAPEDRHQGLYADSRRDATADALYLCQEEAGAQGRAMERSGALLASPCRDIHSPPVLRWASYGVGPVRCEDDGGAS